MPVFIAKKKKNNNQQRTTSHSQEQPNFKNRTKHETGHFKVPDAGRIKSPVFVQFLASLLHTKLIFPATISSFGDNHPSFRTSKNTEITSK